ncbi:hypothetical protein PIB30_097500, partial [Stylosanthes scabra]|nr:hypothetical protein [Stylosanthes scabra]
VKSPNIAVTDKEEKQGREPDKLSSPPFSIAYGDGKSRESSRPYLGLASMLANRLQWNFRHFPNQNRMQLDLAENLEYETNAFVGWAFEIRLAELSAWEMLLTELPIALFCYG